MSRPIVFIGYSHQDATEKEILLSHLGVLQQSDVVELWSTDDINAGADSQQEIDRAIEQAKVAILLISANFLSTPMVTQEIPKLLERRENKELIIFPIIAKACAWNEVGWLSDLSVRPKKGRPIWRDNGIYVDQELKNITEEVAKIIREADQNLSVIQRLLTEILNDEELTAFCYDYFKEVYQQFTLTMTFQSKKELLIEHCQKQHLFGRLLGLIRELNPEKYNQIDSQSITPLADYPLRNLEQVPSTALDPLEIELPYGTMRSDSKFYIERQADKDCKGHLAQRRAVTLFVQAPRQMGKSSLMYRVIRRAKEDHDKKFVYIDFQKFPEEFFKDEKQFLIEFCLAISDALALPEAIEKYWRGPRTNLVKCSNYLSKYVIPQLGQPLILAMDEVERLVSSTFNTNFFGMLRTWHNERISDENLAQMSIFLSSATEPYLLIDNPHQSPFNVAERIVLQDFTENEVKELNRRHHNLLTVGQVQALQKELGGHPYLTRRAFYLIATGKTNLDALLTQAASSTGPFEDHLYYYLNKVLQKSELSQAMTYIAQYKTHEESHILHRLREAGLVKKVGQRVIFRNNLYARYFVENLKT